MNFRCRIAMLSARIVQIVLFAAFIGLTSQWAAAADEPEVDLAFWGSDHVGQAISDYVTGDECLFCHRDIGSTWSKNPHQTTIRRSDPAQREIQSLSRMTPATAQEVDFLIGAERLVRYLKRSQAYGRLELLSARYLPNMDRQDGAAEGQPLTTRLFDDEKIHWHGQQFGERCIGCHTTAVDSKKGTFASISLDCYVCHGQVDLQHTADFSKVLLSKHPQDPLVVNSICSSCHLRGGISQSTGLPYPNAFVPGDNLFRDFQVALSDSAIATLPALQQHIYLSARMVGGGNSDPTCIDCHNVHGNHSDQHMELSETGICKSCHVPDTGSSQLLDAIRKHDRFAERNATCDY